MRRRAVVLSLFVAGPGTLLSAEAAPSPAPPPYSLPWLMRPATVGTVVRLDSTLALFEGTGGADGSTVVESVIASYRASKTVAPLFRVSIVHDRPPGSAPRGGGLSNPLLGVNHVRTIGGPWRLSLFGAATIPIGSGAGNDPAPGASAAMAAAVPARSAMDNALFAVNYFTVIGGAGVARVTQGLTLQVEVTVLQLTRVRGPESQDGSRTNLTAGLHLGRFFGKGKRVSLGGELRLQRWMTAAAPVRRDPAARETVTFGIGPRFHFKAGKRWIRPGFS